MTSSYNLELRTLDFSHELVRLCRLLPKDIVTIPLISQVIRSGTSIGANYREANGASSKKDFRNKIFICKKEAKETLYWLTLLLTAVPTESTSLLKLKDEAEQLARIFSKISLSTNISSNEY